MRTSKIHLNFLTNFNNKAFPALISPCSSKVSAMLTEWIGWRNSIRNMRNG